MVYNCLHGKAPSYLTDCCTPISDVASRRHLRSASRRQLLVPRHNLSTYGCRATNCENRCKLRTVSDSYLKLICLLSTSAYSALEVLHIMCYINLLTYLLTIGGEIMTVLIFPPKNGTYSEFSHLHQLILLIFSFTLSNPEHKWPKTQKPKTEYDVINPF